MNKMKDIYTELTEGIQSLDHRLDQMLQLLKEMVLLEGKIERMEEKIGVQLDRMEAAQVGSGKLVDRLIEMSLIQQGHPGEAVTHRAQTRLENNDFSNPQSWTEEVEEGVWPPPNCDVMESRG
jgi:predicted amino acid racemase